MVYWLKSVLNVNKVALANALINNQPRDPHSAVHVIVKNNRLEEKYRGN